jgi:gluconokinase
VTVPEGDGAARPVVLGADIGTTSTKVVAFDTAGQELAAHSIGYELHEPAPGRAEQDPDEIAAAVLGCLRAVTAELGGAPVAGISFSSAMHSLIGLDHDGKPLTPSITWADSRASDQAERLRATPDGLALHRRTGTPVHPMAPLAKLIWFKEVEPQRHRQVGHWVGIKDYVLLGLCEALVTDHSLASGTGLMDIHHLVWDDEALRRAGVMPEQLPELVPTTSVLALGPQAAAATGLAPGTPVVVGAGDGPLANLGLGAVRPGVAACSIGTSGALRVMVERPAVDPLGGVFCYALTPDRWVVGGAINNGGVVLQWTGEALAPDLGEGSEEELLELAAGVPVGSGGLIMLPYLLSERAPHWSALPRGAYVGLTHEHRRGHLIRAALEGVCQQLALVLHSMRAAGNEIREIRATGGFARSPLWRQMLADTLGMPIHFPAGHEGSGFGAALLGMQALGLIGSVEVAADLVTIQDVVHPDPAAAATYRSLQPVFAELYQALVPAYTSLRRLAPSLPLDATARPPVKEPT